MIDSFEKCVETRKLRKIGVQADLITKELESSKFDLKSAEFSLANNNPKWATVQAYYSIAMSPETLREFFE